MYLLGINNKTKFKYRWNGNTQDKPFGLTYYKPIEFYTKEIRNPEWSSETTIENYRLKIQLDI